MNSAILVVALTLGIIIGWIWARFSRAHIKSSLPKPYLEGLNFLLNEQPDQAIDIFIKLLAADNDNVEMHFALGQLFRRRGEVDRAIRLHQHILARPQLDKQHRQQALLALGKDYLHAGVFDRAERVFQELSRSDRYRVESLQRLLGIYEQEHEWEKAITTAELLMKLTQDPVALRLAHYYCELAQSPIYKGNNNQQEQLLKKALSIYKTSTRAALLLADLYCADKDYKQALKYYLRLEEQSSLWLSEAYTGLLTVYTALGQMEKFYQLLQRHIQKQPNSIAILALAHFYDETQGQTAARSFLLNMVQTYPSLASLQKLLSWRTQVGALTDPELEILTALAGQLGQGSMQYRCQLCGFSAHELHWHCPGCQHWDSVVPVDPR